MTYRVGAATVLACTLVAAGFSLTGSKVAGQGRAAAYRAPRTPDGKPDLNGIWQTMNTANYDLQSHPAKPSPVTSFGAAGATPAGLGVVVGDEIPYTPEGLAKKRRNAENWITSDPEIKCYFPGVPRATYMPFPLQIVQSSDAILIAYEFASAARTIEMVAPEEAPIDSWMGYSHGRWEGDTLVVDVKGFNDSTWFDRAGNHHSDALKVTERYTRVDANVLRYEATIEDPKTFTRPWTISMPLYRRMEKNAQLLEFRCVEFVEELIYGHLRNPQTNR